jgi:hypothetical protein
MIHRAGAVVAILAAVALAAFGLARGTRSVGGSDSSCYALTAQAMAAGRLQPSSALAVDAPWPDAARTVAPGGFIPSPIRPDAAAPICAPGLSVLMAPLAALFGRDAIFWLVPLSGALLVLSSFVIGRQLAGASAGAMAAILTATSPIVLFQVVQPMNDVVTASIWTFAIAAVIKKRHVLAGVAIGIAILVRPNLAPLAVVAAASPFALTHDRPFRSGALMIAAAAPGAIVLLALNDALYGSVLASGYGNASSLFSVSNVGDNIANFGRALFQTQNIIPALALAAPITFSGEHRRLSFLLLAAAGIVVAIYLLYQPYPEWWYLRFLMPAIVLLLVLASAVVVAVAGRARMGGLVPIAAVVIAILGVRAAGDRQAFELSRMEGRYRDTAAVVADRLPPAAVLITVWQSGSVRFHADRDAVLWDAMDPDWLDRAVAWLTSRGLEPYFLFERREEPEFRARFRGHSEFGALDWPPRIDINRQVRIYDPRDRARYQAGEAYATENIRPR